MKKVLLFLNGFHLFLSSPYLLIMGFALFNLFYLTGCSEKLKHLKEENQELSNKLKASESSFLKKNKYLDSLTISSANEISRLKNEIVIHKALVKKQEKDYSHLFDSTTAHLAYYKKNLFESHTTSKKLFALLNDEYAKKNKFGYQIENDINNYTVDNFNDFVENWNTKKSELAITKSYFKPKRKLSKSKKVIIEKQSQEKLSPNTPSDYGIAIASCPSKMTKGVPVQLYAQITKEELANAIESLKQQTILDDQTRDTSSEADNTRWERIKLHETMLVKIEVDKDIIQILDNNGEDDLRKFDGTNTMEWQWTVKPIKNTEKTFINFIYYYKDKNTNQNKFLTSKKITVVVSISPLGVFDKLLDLLDNEPKVFLLNILIPLISFFGVRIVSRLFKSEK